MYLLQKSKTFTRGKNLLIMDEKQWEKNLLIMDEHYNFAGQ